MRPLECVLQHMSTMRLSRVAPVIVLAVLWSCPSEGAAQDPSFEHLGVEHGLSQGSVYSITQYVHRVWTEEDGLPYTGVSAITQTRNGYLWIGTRGGLARFDGARFVPFNVRNTPALRSNSISALYAAPDSTLWIGTLGGLTRYRDGQFTTFTTADGLPSDNVWTVTGEPDGTLWVGTLGGLTRYRDGRFTTFTTADGLLTDDVRAISLEENGTLWAGTYGGGVNRRAGSRMGSFSLVGAPSGSLVRAVLAGRGGRVWIGVGEGQTDRSPHQLLQLEDGRYRPLALENSLFAVRTLHEERDGTLWVGTYGGGLARYANGTFQIFTTRDGLTDDRVQAVYEDRSGNLWVGTMGGLDLLRRDAPLTTYAMEEGLPDDNVRAVTQDARGAIWIATANGAARFDAGAITAFTPQDGLPEPYVHSLWARHNGEVWLGGQHGVTRYADGVFTRYALPNDWPRGAIWSIAEDREGRLWLGSAGGGLIRLDPSGFRAYTVADGLAHNSVTALLADQAGRLWIGTSNGLNRMTSGQIRPFEGAERFAGINVRSLYEDDEGTLWVGTYGRGLMRLRDGHVAVYTIRDGLHDDGVWSILEDARGFLWMSSDRGVFRVAKAELEAVATGRQRLLNTVVYGVADGMKTAEGNGAGKPAGWHARDGRMWFATQRGVVVVDPEAAGRAAPVPIIEGVHAREHEVERGADGTVALPATARDITIAYTSLSFTNPERLRFRYRLDGFSGGWVEAQGRREAVFTNVPSGRYTFRVAAMDGNEVWNEEEETLVLTVAPFFWETTWFRLLVALAVVALVGVAIRVQGRRQRRRAATLEAMIAARTDELRRAKETTEAQALRLLELDDLKSQFFANVSHEFRTPLTLTIGPLDDLQAGLYGPLSAPMAAQVDLARRNARRVLDLINQILDVARLETGRTPLRARPLDLGAFVEAVAQPFRALAARKAMTFEVNLAAAPVEVFADPLQLEKVVANLLSNAFKFTPEGGTIRMSVSSEGGTARVAVRDSGPGIPAADLPHIFDRFYQVNETAQTQLGTGIGLALAKEVVDLHGGTLTVESEEGFGSTFTVTLPLGRAHLAPDQIDEAAEPWAPDATLSVAEPDDGVPESVGEDLNADVTTVLVVEDHPEVRAYVRRHLEATPEGSPTYRVLEAADGEAGLVLAKARLPDLILSDVMMPKLDGLGLCRALKADPETDFIPVILLTAKAAPEDKLEGLGEHADDYLTKPFDPAELRARIANLIAVRTRLRERFRQEGMALVLGEDAAAPMRLPAPAAVTSADDAFLERVREAVEAHLSDETFSVERLAEAAGVSRGHLHRQLKALVGQTPTDLIRMMRLARAAHLLAGRAGTVSEIAYAVGFKSVGHFSDSFVQAYGCRPSAYASREGAAEDETV